MTELIVAIDTPDIEEAKSLMRATAPFCDMFKFGSVFFTANGPEGVGWSSKPFFLDLKYHDIPTTVWAAVCAAIPMKPHMLTVHAAGGAAMLKAACDAASCGLPRPLVIAVTRLTSMVDGDIALTLARRAVECGVDGLVCSGHELTALRAAFGPRTKLVVPGIRPIGYPADDQNRTVTPEEAARSGADWIVVGRPITGASDPAAAAAAIAQSIR